jgi:hypothetical protein
MLSIPYKDIVAQWHGWRNALCSGMLTDWLTGTGTARTSISDARDASLQFPGVPPFTYSVNITPKTEGLRSLCPPFPPCAGNRAEV